MSRVALASAVLWLDSVSNTSVKIHMSHGNAGMGPLLCQVCDVQISVRKFLMEFPPGADGV